jgi:hypothetical protein
MIRLLLVVAGAAVLMQAQQRKAASLITDADVKEFAAGAAERETGVLGDATFITIKAMKGDVFSHHLTVYLQTMPPDIPAYPGYVKDLVTQTADMAMPSDKPKKLPCTVAGSPAAACLEVNAPIGTFKEGQRMVKVLFGKNKSFVKIEIFRDFRADVDFATRLAARIVARLP